MNSPCLELHRFLTILPRSKELHPRGQKKETKIVVLRSRRPENVLRRRAATAKKCTKGVMSDLLIKTS